MTTAHAEILLVMVSEAQTPWACAGREGESNHPGNFSFAHAATGSSTETCCYFAEGQTASEQKGIEENTLKLHAQGKFPGCFDLRLSRLSAGTRAALSMTSLKRFEQTETLPEIL